MSLNSVHQQINKSTNSTLSPDYAELVRFLVQPFLENPDSLSVDCEMSRSAGRVWIRVAFEGEDKGRVYGRGGRNLQAIRTVISAASALAGQSVYLDIFGSAAHERDDTSGSTSSAEDRTTSAPIQEQRRTNPKPNLKQRSRSSVN